MNAEPPIARFQMEDQPRRPGYARRSTTQNIEFRMTKKKCSGKTREEKACRNIARPDSKYCRIHAPVSTVPEVSGSKLVFDRSLYYPFIEMDDAWLKTQCLYWDSISTIVPDGFRCYTSPTAAYFRAAEILDPLFVEPGTSEVRAAGRETLEYLDTEEGQTLLESSSGSSGMHSKKTTGMLARRLHRGKVLDELRSVLDTAAGKRIRDPWLRVPTGLANYYMTLLASCIARERGYGLLADGIESSSLGSRSMLGVPGRGSSPPRVSSKLAEGLLAHSILRTVSVGPRTSAKKLVKFREKHSAELGRFRTAVRTLIEGLNGSVNVEALASHLETINRSQVQPAVDALRGKLKANRITCGYNNLKLSTLASASPTVLGTALVGTAAGPFALVAGVGLSIVLTVGNYRLQREDLLRSSPYSFVALAERRFGKTTPKKRGRTNA